MHISCTYYVHRSVYVVTCARNARNSGQNCETAVFFEVPLGCPCLKKKEEGTIVQDFSPRPLDGEHSVGNGGRRFCASNNRPIQFPSGISHCLGVLMKLVALR